MLSLSKENTKNLIVNKTIDPYSFDFTDLLNVNLAELILPS